MTIGQILQDCAKMKTLFIISFSIVIQVIAAKYIDVNLRRMRLAPTACQDAIPNCNDYGWSVCTSDTYNQWATQNCAKTCQKCPCQDAIPNCYDYDWSVCTSDTYNQWATQNCAKTCQKCPSPTGTGNGGNGNGGTISGGSGGCAYKSQTYKQGQSWKDGCKYICHCVDGLSGQYTCKELCLKWKLPTQCHMQPPIAGKCCGQPYCPDGIILNYPPGRVDQDLFG